VVLATFRRCLLSTVFFRACQFVIGILTLRLTWYSRQCILVSRLLAVFLRLDVQYYYVIDRAPTRITTSWLPIDPSTTDPTKIHTHSQTHWRTVYPDFASVTTFLTTYGDPIVATRHVLWAQNVTETPLRSGLCRGLRWELTALPWLLAGFGAALRQGGEGDDKEKRPRRG